MNPVVAGAVLVAGCALILQQSWVVAVQDLDLRPVALAAYRKAPLPPAEALPLLESARARDGTRADACLRLGEALDAASPPGPPADPRIGARYREAARAFPASGLSQYRLAMILLREGREPEGRHHLAVAADCAGNHPALLAHLGDWHLGLWKRTSDPAALLDALSFHRRAVARDPWLLLPALRSLDGSVPRGEDLRSLAPADGESQATLALFLLTTDRGEVGARVLEAAGDRIPPARRADLHRARGRALLGAGRREEAFACFRASLAGGEDGEAAAAALEGDLRSLPAAEQAAFWAGVPGNLRRVRMARARALLAAGEAEAGLALLDGLLAEVDAAEAEAPGDAALRRLRVEGRTLRMKDWIRRGEPLQAALEAAAIARIDGRAASFAAAARLYAAAGDAERAREAWEAALARILPGEEALEASLRRERAASAGRTPAADGKRGGARRTDR
ncbi:MAG: hypothetical protein L6R43_01845 [Planctomycetes bacterium]|nr:hypothetical protein [Planctomycetota bacterium]